MSTIQVVLAALGSLVVIVGAVVGAVRWALAKSVKNLKRADDFLTDWYGEEARPGVARRPGVMERLANQDVVLDKIQNELTTNGGASLKDRVVSMDGRLAEVERKVGSPVTVNVNPSATPS